MLRVSRISAQTVGLVTSATVIIRETKKSRENSDRLSNGVSDGAAVEPTMSFCNISVVNEIVHRIIVPYVGHSARDPVESTNCDEAPPLIKGTTHHTRTCFAHRFSNLLRYTVCAGLLLVGPPGVGKTYAVKAVQRLCSGTCKVHSLPT